MKFTCEQALLLQAVNLTSRTVAVKNANSALEGILLEAGPKGLVLTGYDLETGIRAEVGAEVSEGGSLVLPAKLFSDIVRRLPDDCVVFESRKNKINIRCGDSEYNILGQDAEEYPQLPDVDGIHNVTLQQRDLKTLIGGTIFAVSTDMSRPVHTGALFEVDENGRITVVAVDGYRLALRRAQGNLAEYDMEFSFVVPGKALREADALCSDSEDPIRITQGEKHLIFSTEGVTLISRRLTGNFLDYKKTVPQNNPTVVHAARTVLTRSVERVALIISEKTRNPLRCRFSDGVLNITTNAAMGTAEDSCPISGDGKNLEIGFNDRYLLDALKACSSDELSIALNTPVTPAIITPADGSDDYLYMVLPVRLRQL